MELSPVNIASLAGIACVVYAIGIIIYRLTIHPLAKFPGPKLAGATYLFEFYYDVIAQGGGQYTNEVFRMHDMYGPVVRVTPDEVHIRDAEWASVLYAGPGRTRIKCKRLSEVAGTGNGCFGTADPQLHRKRRVPVNTFYSRNSISRMQGKIWQQATHLCNVLERHLAAQSVVNGRIIFLGWSNDSLRTFAFGKCLSLLDDVGQAHEFQDVIHKMGSMFGWLHFATGVTKLALSLPPWLFDYVKTPLNFLIRAHVDMIKAAKAAHQSLQKQEHDKAKIFDTMPENMQLEGRQHDNLFQAILYSSLEEEEKQPRRLAHEGLEMLLAGSDPAARTMSIILYHLVANPAVLAKLQEELRMTLLKPIDEVDIRKLESLPYLNACLKEALRLGQTTDHRFGLVAPDEDLVYVHGEQTWVIKAGVTVSMTPARAGLEAHFFPEPRKFKPERWIKSRPKSLGESEEEDQRLALMNKVFMPFAKGTRNCLGEFFALTELRVAVAKMFRSFEFQLYDTVRERDVDVSWNHISGEPRKGSKGVRFKVVAKLD